MDCKNSVRRNQKSSFRKNSVWLVYLYLARVATVRRRSL